MTAAERAREYARLFTAVGNRWRQCVPIDGAPHRTDDAMVLDGVRIARPDGAESWALQEAS